MCVHQNFASLERRAGVGVVTLWSLIAAAAVVLTIVAFNATVTRGFDVPSARTTAVYGP